MHFNVTSGSLFKLYSKILSWLFDIILTAEKRALTEPSYAAFPDTTGLVNVFFHEHNYSIMP